MQALAVCFTHSVSKRLQVVVGDEELTSYERAAKTLGLTLSEWARQSLRLAQRQVATENVDGKLAAIRAAYSRNFPTADIDNMLAEIEGGC